MAKLTSGSSIPGFNLTSRVLNPDTNEVTYTGKYQGVDFKQTLPANYGSRVVMFDTVSRNFIPCPLAENPPESDTMEFIEIETQKTPTSAVSAQ